MGEKPLTGNVGGPDKARPTGSIDPDSYCRSIETYLCRRNNGQLVRIVGPAFDLVRGWAERGVPLSVVCRGIDHRIDRLEHADRRRRRRRPIRIEFCEDDVLDVFDEWRRAVGVRTEQAAREDGGEDDDGGRRSSLPAHLQRAIARLTTLRDSPGVTEADRAFVDGLVRELELMREESRSVRGERRDDVLRRLIELDSVLSEWVTRRCPDETLAGVRREAERELAPFRERMPDAAYARSVEACCSRILRERAGVPCLKLD